MDDDKVSNDLHLKRRQQLESVSGPRAELLLLGVYSLVVARGTLATSSMANMALTGLELSTKVCSLSPEATKAQLSKY